MEICKRLKRQALFSWLILSLVFVSAICFDMDMAWADENQNTQAAAEENKETVKNFALGGAALMMSNSDSQEQVSSIEKAIADTIEKTEEISVNQETKATTEKNTSKKDSKKTVKKTSKKSSEKVSKKKSDEKSDKKNSKKKNSKKKDSKKKQKTVKESIPVDQLLTAKVDVALNIRDKANTDCDVVGKLYRGGAAKILKKKGKWYKIQSGKVTGWVRKDLVKVKDKAEKYLEKVNPKTATVTGSYVNIRKKASTGSDVVAVVQSGAKFTCLKKGKEWVKVQITPDHEGYIYGEYVDVVKDYSEAVTTKTLNKYLKAISKKTEERRAKEAAKGASGDGGSSGGSGSVGDSEFMILAAICEREAGSHYENCVAVANVVLNRVNSSSFPNSISGVVFQPGQFCSRATLSKFLNRGPNSTAISAARAALNGYNNVGSRKSFRWVHQSGAYNHSNCITIGDNVFF